ncbi:MAG TPA: hypothetical protein VFF69_14545 [Phycisphaerales bacterium]|nr:hypothetical protein [Phycisphaerales bacterium]
MRLRRFRIRAIALSLLTGLAVTIALSWLAMPLPVGNAWYGPYTTHELGIAAASDGKLYQISRATNAWHTTVSYWWMQVSGMSLSMPTADFESRKYDIGQLPGHFCPESLDDLNMQAWYHASGWPFRSLACSVHWKRQISNADITYTVRGGVQLPRDAAFNPRALPLTPIWPGLLADTLFFAAVSLQVARACLVVRRRRRRRRNVCPLCRYPRASLPPGAPCPECGAPTPAAQRP